MKSSLNKFINIIHKPCSYRCLFTSSALFTATRLNSSKLTPYLIRRSLFSYPAPRQLNEIVKLELLLHESAQRVREIWLSHHNNPANIVQQTTVVNCINKQQYIALHERGKQRKFFVLPVFRGDNSLNSTNAEASAQYENVLVNFQFPHILFTSLHEYKNKGANAAPYTVLTLYNDLLNSHDLSLLRMDLMSVNLSKQQATQLYSALLHFYLDDQGYKFVKKFNDKPKEFSFDELLEYYKRLAAVNTA
jgi:ATP synthase F1 complex assembly factor 1